MKPEFQSKLLEWCGKISQEHKQVSKRSGSLSNDHDFNGYFSFLFQGLHVIKTVVDLRGMKRFKKKGDNADAMSTTNALSVDLTNQA